MSPTRIRPRWLPEMLARLTAASGIGYVAAAYSLSRWLTRPSPARSQQTPGGHGWPWEPLSCHTADGLRLAGWVVEPAEPKGTVVLWHGLRGNREQILPRCNFLAAAGYRCVAFDHRAHGQSAGRCSSFGYFEARDVVAVRGLVEQRWPHQPCAALGISMGAAALCFAGGAGARFDAVILEGLYLDIDRAFRHRLSTIYPPWFRHFGPGVVRLTERRIGVRMSQIAPVEHIHTLAPAPVLLLTGTEDLHAPPEEAQELFARLHGQRELWLVPNAGHKNVLEVGGAAYRERVLSFLRRHLGGPEVRG